MSDGGWRDPYCYRGTGTLRNKLGERDPAALAAVEANVTALRIARLTQQWIPGGYDLDHLRAFHGAIFEPLYEWAGQLRTVDIAKDGDSFHPFVRLEQGAQWAFGELAREDHLRGLDRERFVSRLAVHLGNVNELHPFREGNGRAQRAFFAQLAADAGYRLDWSGLDRQRNIDASREASRNPQAPLLASMLDELVTEATANPSRQPPPLARAYRADFPTSLGAAGKPALPRSDVAPRGKPPQAGRGRTARQ